MNEVAEQFRRAAESYCALIEETSADGRDVYDAILERLASLYLAGQRLPQIEPATEEGLPDRPTMAAMSSVTQRLSPSFEPRDFYWSVDPYDRKPQKNTPGSTISGDLAEIWRDVKQGLLALEAGSPEDDVVWDWWFGFDSHWGRHAVDALAALHKLRSDW